MSRQRRTIVVDEFVTRMESSGRLQDFLVTTRGTGICPFMKPDGDERLALGAMSPSEKSNLSVAIDLVQRAKDAEDATIRAKQHAASLLLLAQSAIVSGPTSMPAIRKRDNHQLGIKRAEKLMGQAAIATSAEGYHEKSWVGQASQAAYYKLREVHEQLQAARAAVRDSVEAEKYPFARTIRKFHWWGDDDDSVHGEAEADD